MNITPPLNGRGGVLEAGTLFRVYTGLEVKCPCGLRFMVETTETAILNGLTVVKASLDVKNELVLYVHAVNSWFFEPMFLAIVSPLVAEPVTWTIQKDVNFKV